MGGGYNIQFILYPYGSHFGKWATIQATKISLNYIWCGIFCGVVYFVVWYGIFCGVVYFVVWYILWYGIFCGVVYFVVWYILWYGIFCGVVYFVFHFMPSQNQGVNLKPTVNQSTYFI